MAENIPVFGVGITPKAEETLMTPLLYGRCFIFYMKTLQTSAMILTLVSNPCIKFCFYYDSYF